MNPGGSPAGGCRAGGVEAGGGGAGEGELIFISYFVVRQLLLLARGRVLFGQHQKSRTRARTSDFLNCQGALVNTHRRHKYFNNSLCSRNEL